MDANQINDIEVHDFVELRTSKEFRVYVIDPENKLSKFSIRMTDEQFMAEAEMLGTVYTLEGFEKAFNQGEILSDTDYIKIIQNGN